VIVPTPVVVAKPVIVAPPAKTNSKNWETAPISKKEPQSESKPNKGLKK
jgi:hypothetical protein